MDLLTLEALAAENPDAPIMFNRAAALEELGAFRAYDGHMGERVIYYHASCLIEALNPGACTTAGDWRGLNLVLSHSAHVLHMGGKEVMCTRCGRVV